MAMYGPKWWHHHGSKMGVASFDPKKKSIVIANNAASLKLRKVNFKKFGVRWIVEWNVRQSLLESVTGSIIFMDEDLKTAFGLKSIPETPSHSRHLLSRYGGDRAFQGKFIGKGDYLNIPCPGTGYDGDPNISIQIDNIIREAVTKLLSS